MDEHAEAKEWLGRLEATMAGNSAEDLAMGIARLVLMKDEFKSAKLYRSIFRTMAAKLTLKTMEW